MHPLPRKKRGYDANRPRARRSLSEVFSTFFRCCWTLLFPVLLIVTIRFGIFTPTEVGAFAVFYVSASGFLVHRELTFAKFKEALNAAVVDTGVTMVIIAMAAIVGYVLAFERLPQTVAVFADGATTPAIVVYGARSFCCC